MKVPYLLESNTETQVQARYKLFTEMANEYQLGLIKLMEEQRGIKDQVCSPENREQDPRSIQHEAAAIPQPDPAICIPTRGQLSGPC